MAERLGSWSWLGDPQPGEPGLASRALAAEQRPRLQYGRTVWVLLHDAAPADVADQAATGLHLRLDAHFSTMVGVVGAPLHLAHEARLRRAVEPLFVAADDPAATEGSAAALLDAAGAAIDGVLG